ncbi:MAG: hypothetical protein WDN03_02345 [Rhizomicrobium sp.]
MEDGLDVSAAERPLPTEIEASFVVLGPRNEGSNYGIITQSPGAPIDNVTRQLLEDYALMTLAAAPLDRRYLSFLPLGQSGLWLLASTSHVGEAQRGAVRITWGLLLDEMQVWIVRSHLSALAAAFPPPAAPAAAPDPLVWRIPSPSPRPSSHLLSEIGNIVRDRPTALMVPSTISTEDAALQLYERCSQVNARLSFVTRPDLEARGGMAAVERPWLIVFTEDDPPVPMARFEGYHPVRLTQERHLVGAPPIPAGRREWFALLDAAHARYPHQHERLLESVNQPVNAVEDDPEGVVAAKVTSLARRLFTDPSALTALTWLGGGAAALSEEQVRLTAIRAFQKGFAQAVPHAGQEASDFLDRYTADLEWFLTPPRPGVPRDPFAAELALDRGIVFLAGPATLSKIADDVLMRPEKLSLSLRWASQHLTSFLSLMRELGRRLAEGPPDLTLAESGRLLLEKWTQLRGQDRTVDDAVVALIRALARQPYHRVLARLFHDGLGRALLESGGRDRVRAIMNDVAKGLRGLGKGAHRNADALAASLLLTVQIARLFR